MNGGHHNRGYQRPPGPVPQYAPHHETFILPQVAQRETSITRMTVPVLLVASLGVFLVVVTYLGTSQFADIKHAIDKLSGKIETLTGELAARITRLEQDASVKERENWTLRDHEVWCAKAERANQAIGWTCAGNGNGDVAHRYQTPQVQGWTARAKP